MYAWEAGKWPNVFFWTVNWGLSLFGLREKGSVTLRCENPDCKHEHSINVWHYPGMEPYAAIKELVKKRIMN